MNTVTRIAEVREIVGAARRSGKRIALVPTMGFLHPGHLALVAEAGSQAELVVMSLFVNPLQFGPTEDLSRYPRDLEGDTDKARSAGVDLLFVPETTEMYAGPSSVIVVPRALADLWEGAVRPGHFDGVLTVVAKLFNIVQPDIAIFGQKDIQQVSVVRAMVSALNFPIQIVVAPTVREADGLAMSSRNAYLGPADRVRALALSRALSAVEAAWREGTHDARALEHIGRAVLAKEPSIVVDYLAVADPKTLQPATVAEHGTIVMTAARVGRTRLIDNIVLGDAPSAPRNTAGESGGRNRG